MSISPKIVESFWCPVCYGETTENVGLECGHKLCYGCYKSYLIEKVKLGPEAINTSCPHGGCKLLVPEALFSELCD